jgi:hypothetical protein
MRLPRAGLLVLSSVILVAAAGGCSKPAPSSDEGAAAPAAVSTTTTTTADAGAAPTPKAAKRRKPRPPRPPEHLNPGPEALARKARSEARLKSEGVTTNAELPVIDSAAEAKLRTRDAVVDRALALLVVATKGEGLAQLDVIRTRDKLGAAPFLSPDEKDFVDDVSATAKDKAQFGWRYEGLGVMLWALHLDGSDAELPRPAKIVDAERLAKLVLDKGPEKLRAEARLRSAKEILDATDLVYRYDWACVAARMSSEEPPKGVDCEVVLERHRALNWLIGYQNQAWDDVSTDT